MRSYALNVACGFTQRASTRRHRLLNFFLNDQQSNRLVYRDWGTNFFLLKDEKIITTKGNYANQLLYNLMQMRWITQFHSQEYMAINNCGQQEFDLLLQERQEHSNRTSWMFHLNMSSLQNKFDELKLLNDKMKSQIIFLSEKKIDISYPNSQFTLTGYNMYRKDR